MTHRLVEANGPTYADLALTIPGDTECVRCGETAGDHLDPHDRHDLICPPSWEPGRVPTEFEEPCNE